MRKIIDSLCRIRHLSPLIKALSDKRDNIKFAAMEALGKLKGDETKKAIARLLRNKDRLIRNMALKILYKIEAFDELLNALKDPKISNKAIEILSSSNNEQLETFLIEKLKNSDEVIRGSAAEILGILKVKSARVPLINLLNDPSSKVVSQVIEALAKLKKFDTLIRFTDDKEEFTPEVVEVIGLYGGEEDYDTLTKYLKNDNSEVRAEAALALGRIECHKGIKNLINMLKDSDGDVRVNACLALGKLNAEQSVEPLCKMLRDKNPDVRKAVKASLEQLCLSSDLRDLVISSLNKISSFSLGILFSKDKKVAKKEAMELLETINVLNS